MQGACIYEGAHGALQAEMMTPLANQQRLSQVNRSSAYLHIELPTGDAPSKVHEEQRAALVQRIQRMLSEWGRELPPAHVLLRLAEETFPD
jgi:hypothetical protein